MADQCDHPRGVLHYYRGGVVVVTCSACKYMWRGPVDTAPEWVEAIIAINVEAVGSVIDGILGREAEEGRG